MDMQTRHDIETVAEYEATVEAWRRLEERRAARRRSRRFWFNWRQIADDPGVAVPASEVHPPSHTGGSAPSGAGSGASGFRDVTSTHALTPLASGSRLPGGPTPLTCSRASRISAAPHWH